MPIEAGRDASDDAAALEREARNQVKAEKEFYQHLASFVLVNAFLVAINVITSPEYFWAIWPLLGWGVGLGSHFVQTFGVFGLMSGDWEERKVREYVIQRQHGLNAQEVKQLMRSEIEAGSRSRGEEMDRLFDRLENLEAIVTSTDWEHVTSRIPSETLADAMDEIDADEEPRQKLSRIARRVR